MLSTSLRYSIARGVVGWPLDRRLQLGRHRAAHFRLHPSQSRNRAPALSAGRAPATATIASASVRALDAITDQHAHPDRGYAFPAAIAAPPSSHENQTRKSANAPW